MKIEKLNFSMQKRQLCDPEYDFSKGIHDKINELIEQTNENTEILTKTINMLDIVVNRFNTYFEKIADEFRK